LYYFVHSEPFTINLATSLNSYATDGAITRAVSVKKIPNKLKKPIKILQEYKGIINFLEKRISQLEGSSQDIVDDVTKFGDEMRKHFSEEEEIVFPLALKADSM
jgi:hemerythrin-like domain-containing protein